MLPRWRTAVGLFSLLVVIGLGVYQETGFAAKGVGLGSDYRIYSLAVDRAYVTRYDPYFPHSIGGYLYPPPSLLLIQGVKLGSRLLHVRDVDAFVTLSLVSAILALALLSNALRAGHLSTYAASLGVILLASAGSLETIHCGQINLVVLVFLALMIDAWRHRRYALASVALAVAICLKATPIVFAILFLTRRRWKWLCATAFFVGLMFLGAMALLPPHGLTMSFLSALWWASHQEVNNIWNNSLSIFIPSVLQGWSGGYIDWKLVQSVKLVALLSMLLVAYRVYLARQESRHAENALLVACTFSMVFAPNILWLHHAALLIPAFWICLTELESLPMRCATALSLLLIQVLRWYQWGLGRSDSAPFAVAQLILVLVALAYVRQAWRAGLSPAGLTGHA